jgi:NAD(P)-dependent dehydrogenase (short-subunit alcohol dehydrogenase family)
MKTAFFTGATGGLGSLCVTALSETGNWTIFAAGTNETRLAELAKLPNVIPIAVDITSQESVQSARNKILRHTDRLDAIINFAGLTSFNSMVEGDCVAITEQLLAVNVMGTVRVNRVLFDLVYAAHGRIINCSSEAGWMTSQPFAAPYYLSKRAIEAYNDSLRRELLHLDIPVIKIQPGSFDTAMTQSVRERYNSVLRDTHYYKKILLRMRPLMDWELNRKNDPEQLVKAVRHALEAKYPRLQYRVGTGKLLAFLDIFPERVVDSVYRFIFKRS